MGHHVKVEATAEAIDLVWHLLRGRNAPTDKISRISFAVEGEGINFDAVRDEATGRWQTVSSSGILRS